jgi:TIR domain
MEVVAKMTHMALKTSDRVTLMKEIAKRLGSESWTFVDTTLDAFGLPTKSDWGGDDDHSDYVLAMIKEGPDDALLQLAEHLGFQLHSKAPVVDPPFWRKGMLRLFITHLANHRGFATELQGALEERGISGFVAHNDIEPTLEWQNEIETALSTCEALVALLHPNFHKSNWTDQEIGYVMGRGLPVFTIGFGRDPYGFIARFQAFDGENKSAEKIARELFEAFLKNKQTKGRMADALVNLFAESESFADAKHNMGLLEEITSWKPSYSARLRSAVKHNRQIRESFGVSQRVENLIEKWK